jgi:hypothetical protein
MGSPVSQVASSTQPQGKAAGSSQLPNFAQQNQTGQTNPQPMAKGGGQSAQPTTTNSATSGRPQMGQPNPYSNTIQPWDNASIQPRQTQSGKGKGY